MSAPTVNLHASALLVGAKGVIVFGASGSGKTSLVLELIRESGRDSIDAKLVADDRVDVYLGDGKLHARAPEQLAGLVEVRGSGIHKIKHVHSATLDLAVELVEAQAADRVSPSEPYEVAFGVAIPVLRLPIGDTAAQVRAVLAHLGLYTPLNR